MMRLTTAAMILGILGGIGGIGAGIIAMLFGGLGGAIGSDKEAAAFITKLGLRQFH